MLSPNIHPEVVRQSSAASISTSPSSELGVTPVDMTVWLNAAENVKKN